MLPKCSKMFVDCGIVDDEPCQFATENEMCKQRFLEWTGNLYDKGGLPFCETVLTPFPITLVSLFSRYNPPQSKSGIQTKYKNLEDIAARSKSYRTRPPHSQSLSAPTTPTSSTTPASLSESEDTHVASSRDGGRSPKTPIREDEEKETLLTVAKQHPSMQPKPRVQTFFSRMKTK